jgi:uncharacterized protein (TIGR02145 family)
MSEPRYPRLEDFQDFIQTPNPKPQTQAFVLALLLLLLGCGGNGDMDDNLPCSFCVERCGNSEYNPTTQFCVDAMTYDKCGGRDYNISTQFCSGSSIYSKPVQSSSSSLPPSSSSAPYIGGNDIANYRTVQIGAQRWMAENLNYAVSGSKCYGNDPANCDKYGMLYDWATAMALPSNCNSNTCSLQITEKHRGICPAGWHIPSRAEWSTLISYVGSNAGTKLKAASGWNSYSGVPFGTDDFGFAALPSGAYYNGGFSSVGIFVEYWNASEDNASSAYDGNLAYDQESVRQQGTSKSNLLSVRCVGD